MVTNAKRNLVKKYFMIATNCGRWQTGQILKFWKRNALCIFQVSLNIFITIQAVESGSLPKKYDGADSAVCMVLKIC